MKILTVFCHPRRDSHTARVKDAFNEGASSLGHIVQCADLYAEGFCPLIREADEPDWQNINKRYSDDVHKEWDRICDNDATVMVFPIWWWSMPAMLKGWIDRVWNYGLAYGSVESYEHDVIYPHEHVLMITVGGAQQQTYQKRGYETAVRTNLDMGILDYCNVKNHGLQLFYNSVNAAPSALEEDIIVARTLGTSFPDFTNTSG